MRTDVGGKAAATTSVPVHRLPAAEAVVPDEEGETDAELPLEQMLGRLTMGDHRSFADGIEEFWGELDGRSVRIQYARLRRADRSVSSITLPSTDDLGRGWTTRFRVEWSCNWYPQTHDVMDHHVFKQLRQVKVHSLLARQRILFPSRIP